MRARPATKTAMIFPAATDATRPLGGWRLSALATLGVCATVAGLLIFYGAGEAGLRAVIRATARTSFLFFVAGFVAPALLSLRPARPTRWLAVNQSHLFASFAASHLIHAAAIFTLAWQTRGASLEGRSLPEIVAGGFVYLYVLVLAAPAFPAVARWFESRPRARTLRTFGLFAVWLTFMNSYGPRAAASLFYAPFALALVAALALWLHASLRAADAPEKARADARI